jgi:hypothetical protein
MPNLTAHRDAVAVAEAARQASLKSSATEADRTTAHITYHKAVLASARANGVRCNSIAALARHGVDPGDWRAGDV